jgi:hypothetical protein
MSESRNSVWEGGLEAVAATGSVDRLESEAEAQPDATSGKKKVCCVCGKDVAHEQRFKDKSGHYWCADCNRLDEAKKHPAQCPDCAKELTEADLVDYAGTRICKECAEKRALAAKRAAARIAAAEEEAREQAKRKRLTLIIVCCVAGAGLIYGLIMYIIHLLAP